MPLAFDDITIDPVSLTGITGIDISVLRLDRIHPVISGNKWFKLQYYLAHAKEQGKKRIVTFGGAWSNHIVATAAACNKYGFAATGIIRGGEPPSLSTTLKKAKEYGMQLYFTGRGDYRQKIIPASLQDDDSYFIGEGGYGSKGAEGAADILNYTPKNFTHYCCAAGTGTMMAGLINASLTGQAVIGISVLKNNTGLANKVEALVNRKDQEWQIIHDYHFGGYARHQPALFHFMNDFYRQTLIPSDFVYTGKLFYAIRDLASRGFFAAGSRLLLIHSGGLQGNASLEKGTLIF